MIKPTKDLSPGVVWNIQLGLSSNSNTFADSGKKSGEIESSCTLCKIHKFLDLKHCQICFQKLSFPTKITDFPSPRNIKSYEMLLELGGESFTPSTIRQAPSQPLPRQHHSDHPPFKQGVFFVAILVH